jgi:DNA-binding protein H-NS
MAEIIISLQERNVSGDTTRENLVQAINLLQQFLKELLYREYSMLREQAELLGISMEELVRMPRPPRRGKMTIYTHPMDPTKTWHGRGRRPAWVTAFFPEVLGRKDNNGQAQGETGKSGKATAAGSAVAEKSGTESARSVKEEDKVQK